MTLRYLRPSNPVLVQFAQKAQELVDDPACAVYAELGNWLVGVLLDNQRYTVRVEDLGYDRSTFAQHSDAGYRISEYPFVSDFLESEYSGNTVATFCPGSGMAAETLREVAETLVREWLHLWTRAQFPTLFESSEPTAFSPDFTDDDVWETLWEVASEHEFVDRFGTRKLDHVWSQYLPTALALRAKKQAAKAAHAQQHALLLKARESKGRELLTQLNNRWKGRRFDKSNATELWDTLRELARLGGRPRIAAAVRLQPQAFSWSKSLQQAVLQEFEE